MWNATSTAVPPRSACVSGQMLSPNVMRPGNYMPPSALHRGFAGPPGTGIMNGYPGMPPMHGINANGVGPMPNAHLAGSQQQTPHQQTQSENTLSHQPPVSMHSASMPPPHMRFPHPSQGPPSSNASTPNIYGQHGVSNSKLDAEMQQNQSPHTGPSSTPIGFSPMMASNYPRQFPPNPNSDGKPENMNCHPDYQQMQMKTPEPPKSQHMSMNGYNLMGPMSAGGPTPSNHPSQQSSQSSLSNQLNGPTQKAPPPNTMNSNMTHAGGSLSHPLLDSKMRSPHYPVYNPNGQSTPQPTPSSGQPTQQQQQQAAQQTAQSQQQQQAAQQHIAAHHNLYQMQPNNPYNFSDFYQQQTAPANHPPQSSAPSVQQPPTSAANSNQNQPATSLPNNPYATPSQRSSPTYPIGQHPISDLPQPPTFGFLPVGVIPPRPVSHQPYPDFRRRAQYYNPYATVQSGSSNSESDKNKNDANFQSLDNKQALPNNYSMHQLVPSQQPQQKELEQRFLTNRQNIPLISHNGAQAIKEGLVNAPAAENRPVLGPCPICNINDGSLVTNGVACDGPCSRHYHIACSGMKERAASLIRTDVLAKWICLDCTRKRQMENVYIMKN